MVFTDCYKRLNGQMDIMDMTNLRRVRDSNPRNTQMLAIVSHPALYSGLINQL